MIALVLGGLFAPKNAYAADSSEVAVAAMSDEAANVHSKAWAAGIAIAVVAAAGAISMGLVIWKTVEGIARQPEAEGKIRTAMMLGLVFVETAIIYALIVAILIIFVL
ncbi:MAG: ATP synthase F0 subunit C [Lachnospiraceae bacterium]|nr:ATP synthase F0 subunit C [Lachnospiraceae bacterium]